MPIGLVILNVVLLISAIGLLVYWSAVGWHLARNMRRVPTVRDGLEMEGAERLKSGGPRVCVVIPAHNEAAVVGGLVESLVAQDYAHMRVVFALDRCTDDTAGVIRRAAKGDARIEIVEISECAEGWAGKVHAIWSGVQRSEGARAAEVLVFADADTQFHPSCVRATVALMRTRGLAMLSVLSTLTATRWFELVVQPAASFELLRQYPIERANMPAAERRAFANGQFIMFTREAYERLGGHAACKDAVLEDIELARMTQRAGLAAGLFLADGMLSCRMYGNWAEFERGWKRIYIEGANRKVSRLKSVAVRTLLLGFVLPVLAAGALFVGGAIAAGMWEGVRGDPLAIATAIVGLVSLSVTLIVLLAMYTIGRTHPSAAPLYPIGAVLTARILWSAARDLEKGVPTTWAGRTYVREAR